MKSLTTQLPPDLDVTAYNRDERFASALLGVKVETLRGWRKRGCGPGFRRIGGKLVRYSLAGLKAFVEAQPTGGLRTSLDIDIACDTCHRPTAGRAHMLDHNRGLCSSRFANVVETAGGAVSNGRSR